ncbi:MAG: pyrimidine-nucleoside phosphorylase [Eubacterium sp.]|nr:pyrimidine-nucleoside phosphorylase [Eubacterium sp.]
MRMVDLIEKKREGGELSDDEIRFIINGYMNGDIVDYEMSAMLMAIYFRGMSERETLTLTLAMRDSGDQVDLSAIPGIKVDKHSTGGVGDKTSMIIGPAVAACGIPVAKMSGRGLGFTGGTVDKFESIPGYRTEFTMDEFISLVREHGISMIGQSGDLAPADKSLYALRDVTGTVPSIPLIASSIMSKKLASGADKIVLDVTVGNGAFMQELDKAKELAGRMISIGNGAGKKTVALLTDMNEPLGYAIGNNLEVKEVIAALQGDGPDDLMEISCALSGMMLSLAKDISYDEGKALAEEKIKDGSAFSKFKELVKAQGGDISFIEDPSKFKTAPVSSELTADKAGYISLIDTYALGIASGRLGAGREKKDDIIDMSAGIILHKKIGDHVVPGESIATLYGGSPGRPDKPLQVIEDNLQHVLHDIKSAFTIADERPDKNPLIHEIMVTIHG